MARFRKDVKAKKPWKAECKVGGQTYYLGYWATKEEAVADERSFRMEMTGNPNPGHTDCLCHPRR